VINRFLKSKYMAAILGNLIGMPKALQHGKKEKKGEGATLEP
jgi:hypothetical protein